MRVAQLLFVGVCLQGVCKMTMKYHWLIYKVILIE